MTGNKLLDRWEELSKRQVKLKQQNQKISITENLKLLYYSSEGSSLKIKEAMQRSGLPGCFFNTAKRPTWATRNIKEQVWRAKKQQEREIKLEKKQKFVSATQKESPLSLNFNSFTLIILFVYVGLKLFKSFSSLT